MTSFYLRDLLPWHCLFHCLIVDEEIVLVQLVSELIRLNRAADPEVATVAAQCLAEIGPVNLNVVALRGEYDMSTSMWWRSEVSRTSQPQCGGS